MGRNPTKVARGRRPRRRSGAQAAWLLSLMGLFVLVLTASGGSPSAGVAQSSSSGQSAKVSLTEEDYYGAPSPTSTAPGYLLNFFKSYSKSHPGVTITRQAPVSATYDTHVLSQFSSGSEPDLLMLDNPELPDFASTGGLVPLRSLGSVDTSGINKANLAETTYNKKLYALPLYTNTIAIFYNKQILQQGGVTTLPQTWSEFSADAKKLSNGSHYGFVFSGQAGPGQATWQWDPWAWSNGGQMWTPAAKADVQALSFLTSLVQEGAAPKDVVNWSQAQPIQNFEAGKAAFVENGLWNIPTMQSQFSNLQWGAFQIPTRVAGQTVIAPFGGEVWCIPRTTPAKEKAAFQLLKAMSTSSNIIPLAKGLSDVPTNTSLWHQDPWSTQPYAPFLTELKHGRARTDLVGSKEPEVDLAVGDAIQSALAGNQSPQAAMQQAQQTVNKDLGKNYG